VDHLVNTHGLSVVRACRGAGLSRSAWYRPLKNRLERDRPIIDALQALSLSNKTHSDLHFLLEKIELFDPDSRGPASCLRLGLNLAQTRHSGELSLLNSDDYCGIA
jgi:hypothetical protein